MAYITMIGVTLLAGFTYYKWGLTFFGARIRMAACALFSGFAIGRGWMPATGLTMLTLIVLYIAGSQIGRFFRDHQRL